MPKEMAAGVVWKGKMKFDGRSDSDQTIRLDSYPPYGDDEGMKPTELLLISLAGCAGQTIISLLQKMRQDVRTFSIRANGTLKDDHPHVFTEIRLEIEASGAGLDRTAVEKALQLTEDKYCPVFAMLKKSVDIRTTISLSDVPAKSSESAAPAQNSRT